MELEIVKAEEGMCTGEVLYHQHINKSKAEVAEKSKEIQDREELREKRRRQQVPCPPPLLHLSSGCLGPVHPMLQEAI